MNRSLKRRLCRILPCLLLAAAMPLAGAVAESALEVDPDAAAIEAPIDSDLGPATVSEAEMALEPNAIDEALVLESDAAEEPASPAPRTASAPADFEIDENGVLTKYNGAGGDIAIPAGVTGIGRWAFYDCDSLTGVTIPEGVTAIGDNAFYECGSLKRATIPAGVADIGSSAFENCGSLTEVTIPAGVTRIRLSTFSGCGSLTRVTLPESVTNIGRDAFRGCGSLTSVTIPQSVTEIEDESFEKCGSLTRVTIPAAVTSIGFMAFANCSKLEAIDVADSNPAYLSNDGVLYTRDTNTLVQCPGAKTSVTIPEGVTCIWDEAFAYCGSLTDVTIPQGVTSIESFAFFGCKSLTRVTIPAGVSSIKLNTFKDCSNLTSVEIPETVTSIGDYAFENCGSLTRLTIPEGVTSFGFQVFYGCDNLTIYGKTGSPAQAYANESGIPFVDPSIPETTEPPAVEPESVSIAQGQAATLYAGQTLQLSATAEPADAETTLTWSSSRKSVATVSQTGLVKAIKKGTSAVTVKTANGKSASIRITVPAAPTTVKLSKTKATVAVGATLNLKARLTPTTARTALTWTSSNKKVTTVSDKGVVKALKKGTATITVKTSNGKKATCKITVPAAPTKVKFAKKAYSVKVGKTATLKTSLTPSSAKTVLTFSTSNKKVATVTSKGVVKGIKRGTATITVKTANGKKATVKVTVK